jgi:regulator of protease activity HflC (stomatin/prohibitin superfamily)
MDKLDIVFNSINSLSFFLILFLIAIIYLAKKSFVQVSQSKVLLIERLGKYHRTLSAGINLIVPFLDQIVSDKNGNRFEISVSEEQITLKDQQVTTLDNVILSIELQVFYRIKEASNYVYRIADAERGVKATIDATVRALIGRRTFDQLNADRLDLASDIAVEVQHTSNEWGVVMNRVEITDIDVKDPILKEALSAQASAERNKRAQIIEAEGDAQKTKLDAEASALAIRLNADAILYQAEKKAEAIKITANAEAFAYHSKGQSLDSVGGRAAQEGEILMAQVKAMENLGKAENSKLVILPAELVKSFSSFSTLFNKS